MKLSYPINPIQSTKSWFSLLSESLLHLAFPHNCEGCGTDTLPTDHYLCALCLSELPLTQFHPHANNPVEKLFWGRIPVTAATAHIYFAKQTRLQHLIHQFKYKGRKDLGRYLGRLLGTALQQTKRFEDVDALIPLPLHASKEHKRGFNQATILCEGIRDVWPLPILKDAVQRVHATESQTQKNRVERWQNMEDRFELINADTIAGKHVLLVDDIITTGATLEACGQVILKGEQTRLSIATLCISSS